MGADDADGVEVRRVGPAHAAEVLEVVRAAFAARPPMDPPADALADDEASTAAGLRGHAGLLATVDGRPSGTVVLDPDPAHDTLWLRRFGVAPWAQRRGVASALLEAAGDAALGWSELAVLARPELPATVGFWKAQGFEEVGSRGHHVELRRGHPTTYDAHDAAAMRTLGERTSRAVVAGDVVVLTGELGAGKTTFTQGLGAGLGVRGEVTSPTFVIARVHPSLVGGPDLVHVDAYRLGGTAELDDLDLDASLEESVTVVEWGGGIAEGLAEQRLEVVIHRAVGGDLPHSGDLEAPDDHDPRRVTFRRVGRAGSADAL